MWTTIYASLANSTLDSFKQSVAFKGSETTVRRYAVSTLTNTVARGYRIHHPNRVVFRRSNAAFGGIKMSDADNPSTIRRRLYKRVGEYVARRQYRRELDFLDKVINNALPLFQDQTWVIEERRIA